MKMRKQTIINDAFENFRQKVKIGDGPIAGQIVFWKGVFFEQGGYKRMFEVRRKSRFANTKIKQVGDR